MAALGILASFLPREIAVHYGVQAELPATLMIQVGGAMYLGFAALNWMARSILIGGIYGRPVALGNFFHFAVAAITLLKAFAGGLRIVEILAGAAVYGLFAAWFGLVLFTNPFAKDRAGNERIES